jgi:hypothetical protein
LSSIQTESEQRNNEGGKPEAERPSPPHSRVS